MKKSLLALLLTAALAVNAEELTMEPPITAMAREWSDGTMTGKNTHSAVIGGKTYPEVWQYWCIDSGLTPETIRLVPMKAVSPDAPGVQWLKRYFPVLAADVSADGQKLTYPLLMRGGFETRYTKTVYGNAFSMRNPFDVPVTCYVEGRLRHAPEADVFVYLQQADGKIKTLLRNDNPDALEDVSTKHNNGNVEVRHYLKLQLEVKMAPGDKLVFAAVRPDCQGRTIGKQNIETLRVDDRWGKAWNPILSFEK